MKLQTVSVTPEVAKSWLQKNGMNRRLSKSHVSRLAHQMREGKWVLNGQTICFDTDGRLLDGQHRLNAVVESGATVQMTVAMGVEDDRAFKTYDGVALKRGAHQVAQMMGVKNANNVSAFSRIIMAYEEATNMDEFAQLVAANRSMAPDEVAEKAQEVEREAHEIEEMLGRPLIAQAGSKSVLMAIVALLNRADPVSCASFCRKLKTGMVDSERDPCLLLRDRIMSGQRSKTPNQWKQMLMAITIKAFNAHREGRELTFLRWRVEGNQPERFPRFAGGKP